MIRFRPSFACLAVSLLLPFAAVAGERQRYIVSLADAPLASYRASPAVIDAKGKALAPAPRDARGKLSLKSADATAYLDHLRAKQDAVIAAADDALGRDVVPESRLAIVGNAIVVTLDADEAARLRLLPGVVAVEPDGVQRPLTDAGPRWIGAEPVWNGTVAGSGVRTRGEGIVVGVLDTGIHATHPSFADISGDGYDHANPRGRFYGVCQTNPSRCNDKLIGIRDLTDEGARDGADRDGHGTHVASTVAGNVIASTAPGTSIAVTASGVAPRANIISYKVCRAPVDDPDGESVCYNADHLEALEQAIADGVDVVNASIGGDPVDPWQAVRGGGSDVPAAYLNVRAAGIVPVLAAGNDGPGEGTVGTAANAPWVIAVANATHDRVIGTVLSQVQGTGIAAPFDLPGAGNSAALSRRPVVLARDYGNALCGTGTSEGVSPTGASNPFPAGTFNGQIVVCVRGIYARVEKGYNVQRGGAGGMVLVNSAAEAESIVTDTHFLPAVHIGFRAGEQLVARVAAAHAAGGQVTAEILAPRRSIDTSRADVLAAGSSRGPVAPFGGWMKPNVTAPGTDILAAAQTGNGLAFLSGTSMASPHVAGAAALVAAAQPAWGVAQIESALLTTAVSSVKLQDGLTAATTRDAGAGRVNVADAVRASLYFDVTRAGFVAGDPLGGSGGPTAMNVPSLLHDACFEQCTLRRTATASAAGSWRVELRGAVAAHASASPSTFALGAGQSRVFDVAFDVRNAAAGGWLEGELALVPTAGGGVEQRLPVSVFVDPGAIPEAIAINAGTTGGFQDIAIANVVALPDATFIASPLVPVASVTQTVAQDPAAERNDPYQNPGNGGIVRTLPVPAPAGAATYTIVASTQTSGARNVDLYVGRDLDGDGTPELAEELCAQRGVTSNERCSIDVTLAAGEAATFWFYAQHYDGSGTPSITLEYAAVPRSGVAFDDPTEPSLVATGPGHVPSRAPFTMRVAWHEPRLASGQKWMGIVGIGATRAAPGALAQIPVTITGAPVLARLPLVLDPRGDSVPLSLAAGTAHETLVVDVPPTATSLVVETAGEGNIDLYVARGDAGTGPGVSSAPPRGQAQATSIHAGSTERVDITGATLTPGRWYLTPVNAGTTRAAFTLSVSMTQAGAAPIVRDNGYLNLARGGHGLFFSDVGAQWAMVWYAYLEDGTPTWYTAQAAAPTASDAVWKAPLLRFSWNGTQNQATTVGTVILTRTAADTFRWSWLLDGQWGSEPMNAVATRPDCPTVGGQRVDYTGPWYAPALGGYGFSVLTLASVDTHVAYLYDGLGVPRWLYAQVSPFGAGTLTLNQYRGFCPQCAATAVQPTAVGSLVRSFADARRGNHAVQATFAAPVPGAWSTTHATEKLTPDLSCQ